MVSISAVWTYHALFDSDLSKLIPATCLVWKVLLKFKKFHVVSYLMRRKDSKNRYYTQIFGGLFDANMSQNIKIMEFQGVLLRIIKIFFCKSVCGVRFFV